MTRYRLTAIAAVLMLSSAAVSAQAPTGAQLAPAAPPPAGVAATQAEAEKLVCTRTRQTGSQRVTRLCRTAEEARIERKAAEESMRRKRAQPMRDERG